MFPLELFNLISLHCKPCFFSLNKELHLLYNDEWFQNKLQMLFPGRKLFTITNYKNLYQRYLSETDIYYNYCCTTKVSSLSDLELFRMKGVKAQYCGDTRIENFKYDQILTFNGELYIETDNGITLIDTEVIDISSNFYIKQNEIYYIKGDEHKLVSNEIIGCKQIIYHIGLIWILTDSGVFYLRDFKIHNFYPINNCIKMILQKYNIYVNDIDNNVYKITFGNFSKLDHNFDINCHTKEILKDGHVVYIYDDDDHFFSDRSYYQIFDK